ncbi:MAG: NAD(P)-dependent oxidoreductase, partial [Chloroflexota bacterium]
AAAKRATEIGAQALGSPREVAEGAEVVLLSLPMPADVESVVTGPSGLLSAARTGQVIVDLSTVDPGSTRKMAAAAGEKGVGYLDAPVLGRPQGCGNWTLPVGGDEAALERVRPVLEKLARRVVLVGPSGHGNVVKLLNNLMFGAINAVTVEVMALAARVGMPPKVFVDLVTESGAATVSNLFKEVGPKVLARDFTPLFGIALLHKDNALALNMAREAGMPMVLSGATQLLNEMALARGLGKEDTAAVVKVYEELLKLQVKG